MWKWILAAVTVAIIAAVLMGIGFLGNAKDAGAENTRRPVSAPPRLTAKDEPVVVVKSSVWVPPVEDYNRPQQKTKADEEAEVKAAFGRLGNANKNPNEIGNDYRPVWLKGETTTRLPDGTRITTYAGGVPNGSWIDDELAKKKERKRLRDLGVEFKESADDKLLKRLGMH